MPVAPASAFWDILDGLSQKHVDGFRFDYYKALRAAWLCVGLSGLFGEGAALQGTHLLPLCSFGRGGAGHCCGAGPGSSQRRTGSTCLWRCQDPGYFPCTLGFRLLFCGVLESPGDHLSILPALGARNGADPRRVLQDTSQGDQHILGWGGVERAWGRASERQPHIRVSMAPSGRSPEKSWEQSVS